MEGVIHRELFNFPTLLPSRANQEDPELRTKPWALLG